MSSVLGNILTIHLFNIKANELLLFCVHCRKLYCSNNHVELITGLYLFELPAVVLAFLRTWARYLNVEWMNRWMNELECEFSFVPQFCSLPHAWDMSVNSVMTSFSGMALSKFKVPPIRMWLSASSVVLMICEEWKKIRIFIMCFAIFRVFLNINSLTFTTTV